jgi:hypothetical protein
MGRGQGQQIGGSCGCRAAAENGHFDDPPACLCVSLSLGQSAVGGCMQQICSGVSALGLCCVLGSEL